MQQVGNEANIDFPGEVTSLNLPYRYMPPQRVWFLRRFGLKTGIDFAYFGQSSGMHAFVVSFQMTKNERGICEFEMDFKKIFLLAF